MLEIVEERYGRGATLITSQIPVDRWHDLIGDPTLGDAILDRVIHNAHRLQLSGESLRKKVVQAAPAWPSAQHHGDTKPVQRAMRHPADIIGIRTPAHKIPDRAARTPGMGRFPASPSRCTSPLSRGPTTPP